MKTRQHSAFRIPLSALAALCLAAAAPAQTLIKNAQLSGTANQVFAAGVFTVLSGAQFTVASGGGFTLASGATGIIPTANGGTGIAFFTAAGPTVARVYTFPDQAATMLFSGGALGTPASGSAANLTSFPTFNQNTTGSAAALSISGQTGLVTLTGLVSTNRIKTVRDAADTILELGGSYTPTGTWTGLVLGGSVTGTYTLAGTPTFASPVLTGTLTGSGTIGGSTIINTSGAITGGPGAFTTLSSTGLAVTGTGSFMAGEIGVATNSNAAPGIIGEEIKTTVDSASAVALTTATSTNLASVSLTAGDWDVFVTYIYIPAATTSITQLSQGIGTTTATLPTTTTGAGDYTIFSTPAMVPGANNISQTVGPFRASLAGTTTVFAVAHPTFTASTLTVYGSIRARRVR